MDITATRLLDGNKYTVSIATVGFAQTDIDLMADFDEPLIEVGGELNDGASTVYTTLPSLLRKLSAGFPYVASFDADTMGGNALLAAGSWETKVRANITAAVTALRAKSNAFDGTTTTTV